MPSEGLISRARQGHPFIAEWKCAFVLQSIVTHGYLI